MPTCSSNCEDGGKSSSPIACPFSFDGTSVFTIDVSGLDILVTDQVTTQRTLADVLLQPGSEIFLSLLGGSYALPSTATVQSRGTPVAGVLSTITVVIPTFPTTGNVYPPTSDNGGFLIDCIEPNTNALFLGCSNSGANIPSGTEVAEVIDAQSIFIDNNATGTTTVNESLSFAFPTTIPSTGTCYISPVLTGVAGAYPQGAFRSCAGAKPAFFPPAASPIWDDVTSHFTSLTISWSINNLQTTATTSPTTSSHLTIIGSGTRTFSPGPPSQPLFTPVNPSAGEFRVYRCRACCGPCFYYFFINYSGAPVSAAASGTYSGFSGTGVYSSTIPVTPQGGYYDMGLFCATSGQDATNPETLFGSIWGTLATGSPTSPSGTWPVVPSGLSPIGWGSAANVDACDPTGSFTLAETMSVDRNIVVAGGTETITVTTIINGGTPTVVVTTFPQSGSSTSDVFVSTDYSMGIDIVGTI